jgi:hypothetical protein
MVKEPNVPFFLCAPGHPLLKHASIHLVLPKEKNEPKKRRGEKLRKRFFLAAMELHAAA